MTSPVNELALSVAQHFKERGIETLDATARQYPSETIVIVEVRPEDHAGAIGAASVIEALLPPDHLLVVRTNSRSTKEDKTSVASVADPRVSTLIELLNERSRTSEQLPSLHYIKDAGENLRVAISKRHHIVFGRRGVGKTALMLEAKRQIENAGSWSIWVNMQSLRGLSATAAFLTVMKRLAEVPEVRHRGRKNPPASLAAAQKISAWAQRILELDTAAPDAAAAFVPDAQRLAALIAAESGHDLFIFIDDLHYLAMKDQAVFLDLLHGITRDNAVWLKIAGIKNQCRVFEADPPTGLQLGHDAASILLDVTLEDPKKARTFLGDVLQTYLNAAHISNRSKILSSSALDRLILASAGVPRDFLVLSARAIQIARQRLNSVVVGTQDVNEAAGEAGSQKLADLEEDAASSKGMARARLAALESVRNFTIKENHSAFFRIDFRQKTEFPEEYSLVQSLMDLRMIHLVKGSLSEAHAAGERSEVYLIDLSEYSGSRLKKDMTVLELQGDVLVLRRTGGQEPIVKGDTPRRLVQIFRTGPKLDLETFKAFLD